MCVPSSSKLFFKILNFSPKNIKEVDELHTFHSTEMLPKIRGKIIYDGKSCWNDYTMFNMMYAGRLTREKKLKILSSFRFDVKN